MNAGPSLADLLEQTNRDLAGTDARVYRRVADHLHRSGSALAALQDAQPEPGGTHVPQALLGKGSFQKLTVATLKPLGREQASKAPRSCRKRHWPRCWKTMA